MLRGAVRIGRLFGDLEVRPKLMVLHNLFFIVLGCAVYFSLIPLFEHRVTQARAREVSLVTQMFSEDRPLLRLPGMEIYDYREGTAAALGIPADVRDWLDTHPGATLQDPLHEGVMFRKNARTSAYRRVRLPHEFYDEVVWRAKLTLFIVLAGLYALAVLLLEFVVMPAYVYRPLRTMLAADKATQSGDRGQELIPQEQILNDEIGQIMRSRNATVTQLRTREHDLAAALAQLEETAADLKRKNSLLETAKKNLADQDRLVSLGMLSASVAHELNTPLAVLRGSIEKLIETVDDPASQQRLARMLRVAERLRRISEGLVDFARVRKQESEPLAVLPLIDEAWSLVAIDEKASEVSFSNRTSPDHTVVGNSDRLVQVFVNLLRNALHATGESGEIVVISRSFLHNGDDWVAIAVEDNGAGIPPDVLPNIFEAFVTSRLDARGTGLGLTVAEGIVHQHGGTIEASNRTEGGARLEVRLPAVQRSVSSGQVDL
jgi:signal transduction histidine kinase